MKAIGAWALLGSLVLAPVVYARTDSRLVETLQAIRDRHEVPGLAVLIVDKAGIRESLALGYADLAKRRPMTTDTLVRIGSITKTFNAIGLQQLEAEGQLSLEARLKDLAPDLPLSNPWQAEHPVRLIYLLEHTAGLMDMSREEFAHNEPFGSLRAAFDFAPERRRTHWPPGLYPEYSNVGSGYLGFVIEQVSDMSYAEFMRERVLGPMGLRSATLSADETTLQRLAVGYDTDGRTVIPYWHMVFPPMGAINATPLEMARLPQFFLRRGELDGNRMLARQAIDRMEIPRSSLAARAGVTYGYGPGLDQEIDGHRVWYGHEGDGDGYLSHFAYQKDLGIGYFLTLNAFKRAALSDLKRAMREYLTEGVGPRATTSATTDVRPPDRIVGDYEQLTNRFDRGRRLRLSIVKHDDTFILHYPGGRRAPIVAVAEGLFRHPKDPVATFAIVEVDGRLVIQGDFGSFGKL